MQIKYFFKQLTLKSETIHLRLRKSANTEMIDYNIIRGVIKISHFPACLLSDTFATPVIIPRKLSYSVTDISEGKPRDLISEIHFPE